MIQPYVNLGLLLELVLSSVVWMHEGRRLEVSAPIRWVGGFGFRVSVVCGASEN